MKKIIAGTLALSLVSHSTFAIPSAYVDPVWRPFILLAGDGDPMLASERLQRIKRLQNTMVNNTRYDQTTRAFIDGVWKSMERFDLHGFYNLLPEQKGRARQLNVQGEWKGDEYFYSTVKGIDAARTSENLPLGNAAISVGALKLESLTASRRYVLNGKVQVGMGASSWQTVQQAGAEILNLGSYGPYAPKQKTAAAVADIKSAVQQHNPQLGQRDVEFLVPVWQAFPHLAAVLASVATIEDVMEEKDNLRGYRAYTASLLIDRAKLQARYPELASYLDKIGDLMKANIEIMDENGRLVNLYIDTQASRLRIETILHAGGFVPVRDGKLQLDKTRKFEDKPVDLAIHISADLDVLGVKTQVNNLWANLQYAPSATQLRVDGNINQVPTVKVDGAFMGVVSTEVIDMFIPGNIAGIITEFFTVACQGNLGNGITAAIELRNSDQSGVINASAEGTVVALDNSFVQLGLRIVNTRMIPNERAAAELSHFFFATQEAFYQDFDLFMANRNL